MAKKFYRKSPEQRKQELNEHYEKLLDGVKNVTADPEEYKRYLEFSSKFPNRSFRNQMLIYSQKDDASWVAGLATWNKFGRKVNKGSKGIKIVAPIKVKEIERDENTKKEVEKYVIKGYQMVNVFDVKDTTGVPLPLNPIVPKQVNENDFANKVFKPFLEELRKELPITLDSEYNRPGNGYYSPMEHKIVLNDKDDRDITNKFKTLIHEYAHSIFHSDTGKYKSYDRETKELQAESTAYITSKAFGLDTGEYSFPYIKGWSGSKDEELLITYQQDIQSESAAIIKKIEDVVIERNINFDITAIIERNTTAVVNGEKDITLIQYGDNYTIASGKFNDSALNNLESVKALGYNFKNKDQAMQAFELVKGYIPLSSVEQIDNHKGKTHLYKRNLVHPQHNTEKEMYFVGVASMSNIKAVTGLTNLQAAEIDFNNIVQGKEINSIKKMEKDLASRDLDSDGLTDLKEMKLGTNPIDPDTDRDGIPDNIDSNSRSYKQQGLEMDLSL